MKRSSTLQRLTRRILSGALSVTVMLSGLLFAVQPASAAGTAKTHYEFVATADANANFAELNPNLTVGAKAGSYSVVRSNQNATFFTQDGSLYSLRLFQLYNWVGTRGPNDKGDIVGMTNTEKVNDPDYHFGLAQYRTYCSDTLYKGVSNEVVYYKAPTVNLEMVPESFRPLDTANIGAANLSLVIASPMSAGNTMNVAFDRRLQVKVSLDGTTWLPGQAEIRSAEFLGGGKLGSTDYQLFRFETDDLLSINGVKGNTIRAIKVLPEGSSDCSRSSFYINRMQVNTYATAGDFNTLCPEEVIPTTTYSSGDELRKIVLAEALRTVKTKWSTEEDIVTVSPTGSSAVDSHFVKKTFLARGTSKSYYYLAPVYDRETDASREQFWSQFDNYSTENHSITVTLPQTGSTTITVAAPKNAKYTAEDLIIQKTYQNKDKEGNVTETLYGKHPYGMDCQTFVFNSISRVSRTSAVGAAGTLGATRTRIVQPADSSGMGNLKMLSHPLYTDWDIAHQNAAQKMYESYAAAQPGDIAVHNLSNHVCNVHTRLVRSVSVVRKSDGTINPTQSKMCFLEEAGSSQEIEDALLSTARDNNEVTFANLLNVGNANGSYVIYTLDEYKDGVVENAKVQAVAGAKQPDTTFWNGGLNLSLNSNYRIIRYQVKLVNDSGDTLFDSGLTYPINPCAVGINYASNELDARLRDLPNGAYKIVWEVHSGPFTDYTQVEPPVHADEIPFTVSDRQAVCTSNHANRTALDSAAVLESGSYYLTGDIVGQIDVPAGVTATLCLNGKTITAEADTAAINVAGTLKLCSCGEKGGMVTGTSTASLINVNATGVLHLYSGVTMTNKGVVAAGGGVYVDGGTFHMYGSWITGSTSDASDGYVGGAGVYVKTGTFNMAGGTISGNRYIGTGIVAGGGGVYVYAGTMNLRGGAIVENTASKGGGIYVSASGKLNMTGGMVAGGSAVYSLANTTAKLSGGYISSTGMAVITGAAKREVELSGDVIVSGGIDNYGIVTIKGGTINGTIKANAIQNSSTKVVTPGSVIINGGSIDGTLTEVFTEFEMGTEEASNKVAYSGEITVTGGKFSAAMSREELLSFVPEESDTMTTMYFVKDCVAPNGEPVYEVGEGLCSAAEEKFMDFQSSLDFGVILHADRNFDPYAFTEGYTASAIGQYGTSYGVSFDTTTMPGTLILWAHGIAAKEMHDAITFTVKDRANKVLFNETWSVYDVAKLWHGDEDTSDQTMLADMIAYGNEARKAFKYHCNAADKLPTLSGATVEEPAWHVSAGSGATNGQQKNVVATLTLRERIELNIYVNDKDAQISNVKFGGMRYDAANYTRDVSSGAYTRFTFNNIPVARAKGKLQFTVTMEDGTTFDMKYSIVDYACLATQDMSNNQRDLIIALQKYVDSVYKYFGVAADWVEPDFGNDEIGAVVPPVVKVN